MPKLKSKHEKLAEFVFVLCCCGFGVGVFHRYTIWSNFDLVQADPGDSRFIIFILENWLKSLLGQSSWNSPPIFYPTQHVLAYSDLLVGLAFFYSIARFCGAGLFTSFNLMVVGLSALSFLSFYWLSRRVLRFSILGSVIGSLFFAFSYPKFAQIVHTQLRFDFLLPIMFGIWWKVISEGFQQKKTQILTSLVLFGVFFAVQIASSFYNAWFFSLFLLVSSLSALATKALRNTIFQLIKNHYLVLGLGLGACLLIQLPLLFVYLPLLKTSEGRTWLEVSSFLPALRDFIWQGQEAIVWGRVFELFPQIALENWTEKRIGFGFVTTVLLGCFFCWSFVRYFFLSYQTREEEDSEGKRRSLLNALIPALLCSAFVLLLSSTRFAGGSSGWEFVYRFIPMASGVRAVSRIVLVLILPYSICFAWIFDVVISKLVVIQSRADRAPLLFLTLAVLIVIFAEQLGISQRYSGTQASEFLTRVASEIPGSCSSFYLLPSAKKRNTTLTKESFDAEKYLRANPDVAKNWKASAWEHYERFGKAEGRSQEAGVAHEHRMLIAHYNYTANLVAIMTGIPSLNGYSGFIPPGYRLTDVFASDIEERVKDWVSSAKLDASPCLIEMDLSENDVLTVR